MYFDTSRSEKIVGIVVTEVSHVEEVRAFSNAFVPLAASLVEAGQYLRANANRMLPIVGIDRFLLDPESGLLRTSHEQIVADIASIVSANHSGPILFLFDELLWHIRRGCAAGKQPACDEVARRYANTLAQARLLGHELRRRFPGSGVIHIEPFAELNRQVSAWNEIVMFDDAEYLGFNCYGAIDSCGGRPQSEYLEWVVNVRNALERQKPIGRKVFLVPAAFRDFYAFQEESSAIAQLSSYFQTLDASDIHGGIAAFTWGNIIDGPTAFIGARSLPRVRSVLVGLMRARIRTDIPVALPAALSVVGAFRPDAATWHASFSSIRIPAATEAALYVQTAGMDACTLAVTGRDPVPIPVNALHGLTIANQPGASVDATATCSASGTPFRQSFRFQFE